MIVFILTIIMYCTNTKNYQMYQYSCIITFNFLLYFIKFFEQYTIKFFIVWGLALKIRPHFKYLERKKCLLKQLWISQLWMFTGQIHYSFKWPVTLHYLSVHVLQSLWNTLWFMQIINHLNTWSVQHKRELKILF